MTWIGIAGEDGRDEAGQGTALNGRQRNKAS